MIIRKGTQADLVSVEQLYNDIHTAEETGQQTIGWIRGVYPTRATAQAALDAKDLFVLEDAGKLPGAARINKRQMDFMQKAIGNSQPGMRTLVVSTSSGKGTLWITFGHGCPDIGIKRV